MAVVPICMLIPSLFFFFSSRRRHTRLQGDWSSDVCSSDLLFGIFGGVLLAFGLTKMNEKISTLEQALALSPLPSLGVVPLLEAKSKSRAHAQLNGRSEEHTSELQSPCNLVCRLLLEKKKKQHQLQAADKTRSRPISHRQ